LGLHADEWSVEGIGRMSGQEWASRIEKLVTSMDSCNLFASFPRTSSGLHYSHIKRTPGQEDYIWRHDRRSATINFALHSRSYCLQARFHQKAGPESVDKVCKVCTSGEDETEEHHLLRCPAFFPERIAFCDALTRQLSTEFSKEYSEFYASSSAIQMAILLGRSEQHWAPLVPVIIDMLLRPYLIALADKRKRLIKDLE
jgi:hypothetical protein